MQNFIKFRMLLFMALICLSLGSVKGVSAQEIILNDLGGQPVNISSYKGQPVILFFWTTWCPYCRKELKVLNQQSSVIAKEGIVILGVNVNEAGDKVRRFFEGYALNFKILLDKGGLLADKYSLMGVPTYVFLDKNGEVISQSHSLPDNYKSLLFKEAK